MLKKLFILVFVFFIFVSAGKYVPAELKISGATTIQLIIGDVAKLYEKETGVKINIVNVGGSDVGVNDVVNNKTDIGMVSRKLTEEELNKGLLNYTIGYDSVVVILNTQLEIDELSNEQIKNIYTGKITNWNKINAKYNEKIIVVSREDGRAEKDIFRHYFKIEEIITDKVFVFDLNEGVAAYVESDPYAIGYISYGILKMEAEHENQIKPIKLNKIQVSDENIKNGTYPIKRELNLITNKYPNDNIKRFIDFVLSERGQKIIAEKQFMSIK